MQDDPYAARKKLTFAQAEGIEPLPTQLALKRLSPQLRAMLWNIVYRSMLESRQHHDWTTGVRGSYLRSPWEELLYRKHVFRDHRMADEFENSFEELSTELKTTFTDGSYVEVFDLLQWFLRQRPAPIRAEFIRAALESSRAAYRLLDDDQTIVPISDQAERKNLERAFADLAAAEFQGARAHLKKAAEHLTAGEPADSIRESGHAVESVARSLTGANSLGDALAELQKKTYVHPALKKGFAAIYGFTSDEQGIRHPLLDNGDANVDETDAIFMIGACAAFVSYLVNKSRSKVHG